MALQRWSFTVGTGDAGLRLDQLIATHTPLSRRQARAALKLGGVQVDRQRIRVAGKLIKPGREVLVAFDEDQGEPEDVEIPVIFEDAHILAVSKPAGLPTQGTWASDQHDVLAMIKRQRPAQTLFLLHRLDQGTSGVLLLSKDAAANGALTSQFEGRELKKTYLARLAGPLPGPVEVDRPIGRIRKAVPGRFGVEGDLMDPRPAKTAFRPATAEEAAGLTPGHWAVAEPATGRTHQIRVHALVLGLPVWGDKLYGGPEDSQLWLHAWKLGLRHPISGEPLEFVAPPTRFMEAP